VSLEQLRQIWSRVLGYWQTEPIQVLIELAVIWIVVYMIMRFLRGTRGARIIKSVLLILFVGTLLLQIIARDNQFARLSFLYSNFLTLAALILVVVFQPELRRALVRLGEARLFRQTGVRKARVVEELLGALGYMSRNKIGALIALERQVGLKGIVEAGTTIDGEVSRELLQTIFWPGSALHDMGLVIRGDRVLAAGVQFPLAEGEDISQELGSRHRAAIGLSQECDALIIVVSEETGTISTAERGELTRGLSLDDLRPVLTRGMGQVNLPERESGLTGNADDDSTLDEETAAEPRSESKSEADPKSAA
jgi:diadenylate cyclase